MNNLSDLLMIGLVTVGIMVLAMLCIIGTEHVYPSTQEELRAEN